MFAVYFILINYTKRLFHMTVCNVRKLKLSWKNNGALALKILTEKSESKETPRTHCYKGTL